MTLGVLFESVCTEVSKAKIDKNPFPSRGACQCLHVFQKALVVFSDKFRRAFAEALTCLCTKQTNNITHTISIRQGLLGRSNRYPAYV